jgi:thiol-disulfide isomerase/thioredoxin
MARPGRYRGRRAPLAALGVVMAFGLGAGLVFDNLELRGVTVVPPVASTAALTAPATAAPAEPLGFREAFAAGITHLRQGDAHSAVQAFEIARRANPHAPEIYVNLGFAYLELDQPAAARAVFEQAGTIAPGQVNGYFGLAESLEALGDIEGALGAMRTYLHLAPGDDPFRQRAMSAVWEWESRNAATRPDPAAPDPAASSAPTEVGNPLFDAEMQSLDGAPSSLAAYRGKFLILNIWATWCGPCRAELPSLDRLDLMLDPKLFAVVGVSIDKERLFTREFLADLDIGFPNYWDGEKRLTEEIIPTRAVPLTLIIGPQGEILLGYEGARDWSAPNLVATLVDLAGGDTPFPQRVVKLQEELR